MNRLFLTLVLAGSGWSAPSSAQGANFELVVPDVRAFAEVAPRLPMALAMGEPELSTMLVNLVGAKAPSELLEAALAPYLPNVSLAELCRDARSIHARGLTSEGFEEWMIVRFATASEAVATDWAAKLVASRDGAPAAVEAADGAAPDGATWLQAGQWLARDGATLVFGYGRASDATPDFDAPLGLSLLEPSPDAVPIVELRGRAGVAIERFMTDAEAPAVLASWFENFGQSDIHVRMEAFGPRGDQPGRIVTRMRRDPRSTTTGGELESAFGVVPLEPAWLDNLPAGSMFASASSIDAKRAIPALLASSGFDGLDWKRLEADLGFPLERLWSRMGPEFTLWADPIGGPSIPPTFIRLGVREPDAFRADWDAFVDAVAAQLDDVEVSRRDYKVKDAATGERVPVPITSIRADALRFDVSGFDLSSNPALCLLGETLLIASSSQKLKKELKRHYGDEATPTLDLSQRLKALGLSNATTAWQFDYVALLDGIFGLAKLAGGMGASDMLPFDLSSLPSTASLAKHLRPTFHAHGVDEQGRWIVHEASFGPETWMALVGASRLFTAMIESAFAFDGPIGVGAGSEPAPVAGPADQTQTAITDIRVGIAVFEMMNERLPRSLDELVEPTDVFPEGFLDTSTVPTDGWGQAFRYRPEATGAYRLWSVGPDRIDQDGAGDDVVAGS